MCVILLFNSNKFPINNSLTFQSMVTQGGSAYQSGANATNNSTDTELMVEWFRNEVKWFAIYSCILGAVMLLGTYLAIMLFNVAAHSQVSQAVHLTLIESILK